MISQHNVKRASRRHPRCAAAVDRWLFIARQADGRSLVELRRTFAGADQVGNTLVFNIGGNAYRLMCCVDWKRQWLFFRTLLTHAEYDRVRPEDLCPS